MAFQSTVMAKWPLASVELLAPGFGTALVASKPPTKIGCAGSVTSRIVSQVALPNAVMALRPLKVAGPVAIGFPEASVPEVLVTLTEPGKSMGARLMANEPRPKVVASNRSGSGAAPGLFGSYGPARLDIPVFLSMFPSARSRSVTLTWGRLPPSLNAPKPVVGKSDQVWPLSSDWYTPELLPTYRTGW